MLHSNKPYERDIQIYLSDNARAVVLSKEHFKSVVREAPDGWGVDLNYRP